MLPLRSVARIPALLVLIAFFSLHLRGQDPPTAASGGGVVTALECKVQIRQADSLGVLDEGIRWRMALAALSKPKEAQALYEQVVQLADSTDRTEDELVARKALAHTMAARGQTKQAYEQAMLVADRSAEWLAQQAVLSGAKADEILKQAALERDSLSTLAEAGRRDAESRISEANEDAQFWMWIAFGTLIAALVALVLVLFMNGRTLRQQRSEINGLRADLNDLRDRSQNRLREQAVQPVVPSPPDTPSTTSVGGPVAPPPAVDPIVEAMFRKQGPERLATLRDARQRGDHEKVQRVVHTLKPQLVNFDPALAHLCARITEVGATNDAQRWNADVDVFEEAVSRLLA